MSRDWPSGTLDEFAELRSGRAPDTPVAVAEPFCPCERCGHIGSAFLAFTTDLASDGPIRVCISCSRLAQLQRLLGELEPSSEAYGVVRNAVDVAFYVARRAVEDDLRSRRADAVDDDV